MPTPVCLSPLFDAPPLKRGEPSIWIPPRTLRITAVLAGALMGHDLPRLDAILEYRAAQCDGRDVHSPPQDLKPGSVEIPLVKSVVGGFRWPIPHCSDPIIAPSLTDGHRFYAKRFPTERADNLHPSRRLTINTTGGPFKSYMLPIRARQIGAVAWFCEGDAKKIGELLSGIFVLGKKRQVGGAMVSEWKIEATDANLSWFAPSSIGTVLMRTLPRSATMPADLVGYRKSFGGVVAPFWNRSNFTEVVTPC